jgi:hypothetical protein
MSDSKTKKPNSKQQPVKTIRKGAIAASIWKRQTSTGFEYLEFSLSRSWKFKSGEREGYSQNFFETSEEALHDVIAEACDYIRAYERARAEEREDARHPIDEAA